LADHRADHRVNRATIFSLKIVTDLFSSKGLIN
jgi:hypothetical protein